MNPYLLGLVDVLSIMLALGSSLWVVAVYVKRRRLAPLALVVALAGWGAFGWAESWKAPGYDSEEIARIDALNRGFRPQLEQYRAAHGEYLSSLEEVGVATPVTRYGPVRYEASRDEGGRPRYWLIVGDYVRNGFVSTWRSERGEWGLRSDD